MNPQTGTRRAADGDSLREFARWGYGRLEATAGENTASHSLWSKQQSDLGSDDSSLVFHAQTVPRSGEAQFDVNSPDFRSLVKALYHGRVLQEFVPDDQPEGVADVARRLFPAYEVDGGSIMLAGCTLEDRLALRLDYTDESGGQTAVSRFVDPDGQPINDRLHSLLGLEHLKPCTQPVGLRRRHLRRLIGGIFSPDASSETDTSPTSSVDEDRTLRYDRPQPSRAVSHLAGIAAIWCKYARGKLRFRVGSASAELCFEGWARTLEPPPMICPESGAATFHLAATDDGRIVAAEAIGRCDVSGRRVLRSDLVQCHATQRIVLEELTVMCPVTGAPVLRSAIRPCQACAQVVSPTALVDDTCAACREAEEVDPADWRLAALRERHPGLEKWNRWRIAETSNVRIAIGEGWRRRVLVVTDRQSHEVLHVARSQIPRGVWEPVARDAWDDLLEAAGA